MRIKLIMLLVVLVMTATLLADVNYSEAKTAIINQIAEHIQQNVINFSSPSRFTIEHRISELLEEISIIPEEDTWRNHKLVKYEYDENDALTSIIERNYNEEVDEWNESETHIEIDNTPDGLAELFRYVQYDGNGNEAPLYKITQTFNENKQLVFILGESMDEASREWKLEFEIDLHYGEDNRCEYLQMTQYKGEEIEYIVKNNLFYDEQGRNNEVIVEFGQDEGDLQLDGKIERTFHSSDSSTYVDAQKIINNFTLTSLFELKTRLTNVPAYVTEKDYQYKEGEFFLKKIKRFEYDNDNRLIHVFYDELTDSGDFFSNNRDSYTYNDEGLMAEEFAEYYDFNLDTWRVYSRNTATYEEYLDIDNVTITPNKLSAKNYPNPFNPETTISFNLPSEQFIELSVYNSKGQLVNTLINENRNSGTNSVVWNGTDSNNKSMSSGLYFYRITGENISLKGKMLMLK